MTWRELHGAFHKRWSQAPRGAAYNKRAWIAAEVELFRAAPEAFMVRPAGDESSGWSESALDEFLFKRQLKTVLRHPDQAAEEMEVRRLLREFFDDNDDKAEIWWCTVNPLLGGVTPDQLIELRPGKLVKLVKLLLSENER